jgi:hypothetical protein
MSRPASRFDLEAILTGNEWRQEHLDYQYEPGQIWFPLSIAVDYWDDHFHNLLLHDHVRMDAFTKAIRVGMQRLAQTFRTEKRVVRIIDIGTGTGVWAYFCRKLLHDHHSIPLDKIRIYAIEADSGTVGQLTNPCLEAVGVHSIHVCNVESINFIQYVLSHPGEIRPFDKELVDSFSGGETRLFDCIICECIGAMGDEEGITEIMEDAVRNLARPDNQLLIPQLIKVFGAPVLEDPHEQSSIYHRLQSFRESGGKLKLINKISSDYDATELLESPTPMLDVVISKSMLGSDPGELHVLDFSKPDSLEDGYPPAKFRVTSAFGGKEQVTGFALFFRALLIQAKDKEIWLDTSADEVYGEKTTSDCWKHRFLPLKTPLPVKAGDTVTFRLRREFIEPIPLFRKSNAPTIRYRWDATTENVFAPDSPTGHAGEFSIKHEALADKRKQLQWERFSWFDIYLNLGILSDIVLALCITELFAMAVGAHIFPTGHSEVTYSLSFVDRVVIGGIAAHLVRIVHSFVRLVGDDFLEIEWAKFVNLQRLQQMLRIIFRVLLALFIAVFVLFVNHPDWVEFLTLQVGRTGLIVLAPFAVFAILWGWDYGALKLVKETTNQTGHSTPWMVTARKALRLWVEMDRWCFIITIVLAFSILILHLAWHGWRADDLATVMSTIEWGAALLLWASFIIDYIRNAQFYSGRLKDSSTAHKQIMF